MKNVNWFVISSSLKDWIGKSCTKQHSNYYKNLHLCALEFLLFLWFSFYPWKLELECWCSHRRDQAFIDICFLWRIVLQILILRKKIDLQKLQIHLTFDFHFSYFCQKIDIEFILAGYIFQGKYLLCAFQGWDIFQFWIHRINTIVDIILLILRICNNFNN